jgi:hypothetical protein
LADGGVPVAGVKVPEADRALLLFLHLVELFIFLYLLIVIFWSFQSGVTSCSVCVPGVDGVHLAVATGASLMFLGPRAGSCN